MNHLAAAGYVERRQGVGTFVLPTTARSSSPTIRLSVLGSPQLTAVSATEAHTDEEVITLVAIDGTEAVAQAHVAMSPPHWRTAKDLADWDVLIGAAGWTGCRRQARIDLSADSTAGGPALRVQTHITDEFRDRSCEIILLLNPKHFAVTITLPA